MNSKPKYKWNEPSLFPDDNLHPTNMEHRGYKTITNKNGKTQRLAIIGRTKEDFIRKSQAVWGDQYDYSETVYTTSKSPVTIRCKKHNHYFTVPFAQNHYMKPHGNVKPTGCDLCTIERTGIRPPRGPHHFRTEEEKRNDAEEKARKREERKQRTEHRKNEHSEEARLKRQQEEQAYIEKWHAKSMKEAKFLERLQEAYPDKYDTSLVDFKDRDHRVTLICKEHGEQKSKVATLLKGKGCDYCSRRQFWAPDFERRAREKHGDKYDYSKVGEIKGMKSVVTIICPKHGEFRQRVDLHLLGYGCRECVGYPNKKTPQQRCDEWIKKCIKKYGEGRYDYSRAHEDYVNNDSLVWIRCCIHDHWFQQTPDNNLRTVNGSCPKCSIELRESEGEAEIRRWLVKHHITNFKQDDVTLLLPGAIVYNLEDECEGFKVESTFTVPDWACTVDFDKETDFTELICNNPNVVYFFNSEVEIPAAVKQNGIKGDVAKKVILTDGYPFHTPFNFYAEEVEYHRTFKPTLNMEQGTGWETIVLPFDVTTIKNGDAALEIREFSDESGQNAIFKSVEAIQENTPYLIGNHGKLAEVVFNGQNVSFSTDFAAVLTGANFKMQGALADETLDNALTMNAEGTDFVKADGKVAPFRAVFLPTAGANVKYDKVHISAEGVAVRDIQTTSTDTPWYSIDGRSIQRPVKAGIYVRGGKKVVVK